MFLPRYGMVYGENPLQMEAVISNAIWKYCPERAYITEGMSGQGCNNSITYYRRNNMRHVYF